MVYRRNDPNHYRYRVVEGTNILSETTSFSEVERFLKLMRQNHPEAEVERVQYTDRVNTWRWRNGSWNANHHALALTSDDLSRWRVKRWKK